MNDKNVTLDNVLSTISFLSSVKKNEQGYPFF